MALLTIRPNSIGRDGPCELNEAAALRGADSPQKAKRQTSLPRTASKVSRAKFERRLMLACDIRIASISAQFGLPETRDLARRWRRAELALASRPISRSMKPAPLNPGRPGPSKPALQHRGARYVADVLHLLRAQIVRPLRHFAQRIDRPGHAGHPSSNQPYDGLTRPVQNKDY